MSRQVADVDRKLLRVFALRLPFSLCFDRKLLLRPGNVSDKQHSHERYCS